LPRSVSPTGNTASVSRYHVSFETTLDIYIQILLNRWNHLVWDLDEKHFTIEILDQLFSKSRCLGELLRYLPGIVVQGSLAKDGMIDLYRIKLDPVEHLISTIDPLSPFQLPVVFATC
jgi:hypothetical protein